MRADRLLDRLCLALVEQEAPAGPSEVDLLTEIRDELRNRP